MPDFAITERRKYGFLIPDEIIGALRFIKLVLSNFFRPIPK